MGVGEGERGVGRRLRDGGGRAEGTEADLVLGLEVLDDDALREPAPLARLGLVALEEGLFLLTARSKVRGIWHTTSIRFSMDVGRCRLWGGGCTPTPRSPVPGRPESLKSMPPRCHDRTWSRSTAWAAPGRSISYWGSTEGSRRGHDARGGDRLAPLCADDRCFIAPCVFADSAHVHPWLASANNPAAQSTLLPGEQAQR